jgi:hypothetical protein
MPIHSPPGGATPCMPGSKYSAPSITRCRHDALGDDPALAVDVGHERVERAHALGQAGLDPRPLGGRDHARHRDR